MQYSTDIGYSNISTEQKNIHGQKHPSHSPLQNTKGNTASCINITLPKLTWNPQNGQFTIETPFPSAHFQVPCFSSEVYILCIHILYIYMYMFKHIYICIHIYILFIYTKSYKSCDALTNIYVLFSFQTSQKIHLHLEAASKSFCAMFFSPGMRGSNMDFFGCWLETTKTISFNSIPFVFS